MTDSNPFPGPWPQLWLDSQKQYWDAWMDLSRKAGGAKGELPEAPWRQAMDAWWKAAAPTLQAEPQQVYNRLFDMAKAYMRMGEEFWNIFEHMRTTGGENWQDAIRGAFDRFKQGLGGEGRDPWSGFATFWGLPSDNWRQVVSSFSMLPGDFEKSFRAGGTGEPVYAAIDRMLSLPTFGYTREWQEQLQEWSMRYVDYGRAMQEYGTLLSKSTSRAVDILVHRLAEQAKQGKGPDSLRAMYDLWVDCGEEAYGEMANSEAFSRAQAALTNTLMKVKQHEQQLIEEIAASLNMPTRRELNTALCRQHELRRELRHIRRDLDELDGEGLRETVAELNAEIQKLREELGSAEAGSAGKSRTPAAKKTAQSGKKQEA